MAETGVYAPEVQIVNVAVSDWAAGYRNGDYHADILLPIIEVDKRSGTFHKFNRRDFTTQRSTVMSPDGEAIEGGYAVGSGTYTVLDYAHKSKLSQTTQNNAQAPHDPRQRLAMLNMNALLLDREIRVADLLDNTSNYATANTSAASAAWTDTSSGTPLADLQLMKETIAPGMTDQTELVLHLTLEAFHALIKHPDFLGNGFANPVAQREQIMQWVGIDRLLVSDAQKQTAEFGATDSFSRIWDKGKARMFRVPKGDPTDEIGLFGATFRLAEDDMPVTVREWNDPARGKGGSLVSQAEFSEDVQVVQNDMGYLLTGVA